MKKLLLAALTFTTYAAFAQNGLPNGSFENWTGIEPVSWGTSNIQGLSVPITQSSDAAAGSSSVKGEVVLAPDGVNPYPPVLSLGLSGTQVPVDQDYGGIRGKYKFQPSGQEQIFMSVQFFDAASATVAIAEMHLEAASAWTEFELVLDYDIGTSSNPAAHMQMLITLEDGSGGVGTGSVFHVDDLSFTGGTSGINEFGFATIPMRTWPVPVTDDLSITFALPNTTAMDLEVLDALGRHVETLYSGTLPAGTQRLIWTPHTGFANGVYNLTLRHNGLITTKRLVLAR